MNSTRDTRSNPSPASDRSKSSGSYSEAAIGAIRDSGEEALQAAKNATNEMTNRVSSAGAAIAEKGSELADAATQQAKTFASELERVGRANPLATIAGALVVGVVIGLLGRGRS
jgi:ElaB/YqjD/DUF883 family membrane-anchored ribosome-binding protein